MNAADVLAWGPSSVQGGGGTLGMIAAKQQVDRLLAHGEQGQGVTIEADGDLHPKDPPMTTRLPDDTLWALESYYEDNARGEYFKLVPVSAEAGDTDGDCPGCGKADGPRPARDDEGRSWHDACAVRFEADDG